MDGSELEATLFLMNLFKRLNLFKHQVHAMPYTHKNPMPRGSGVLGDKSVAEVGHTWLNALTREFIDNCKNHCLCVLINHFDPYTQAEEAKARQLRH